MLKIREEQNTELAKVALKGFEDRTLAHFQEFFPRYCEILTEGVMRQLIRHGVDRAGIYNIVGERNVCLYTTLMLVLGSGFDNDPQVPWAAQILGDDSINDESVRADLVFDTAVEYMDKVAGEDYELMGAALTRLNELSIDKAKLKPVGLTFDQELVDLLQRLFPSKCRVVGEETLRELIQVGAKAAGHYGITAELGRAVYIVLMFMLGSRFDRDPQYPWARDILEKPSVPDEGSRADELYEAGTQYLKKWIQ